MASGTTRRPSTRWQRAGIPSAIRCPPSALTGSCGCRTTRRARGIWALALFPATGNIEISKAASAITPAIALLVVLATALDGLQRRWASSSPCSSRSTPSPPAESSRTRWTASSSASWRARWRLESACSGARRGSRPSSRSCPRPCASTPNSRGWLPVFLRPGWRGLLRLATAGRRRTILAAGRAPPSLSGPSSSASIRTSRTPSTAGTRSIPCRARRSTPSLAGRGKDPIELYETPQTT